MSSDSDIGNEVEQELEAKPRKSRTAPKRLTTAEKFRLLEDWKKGKIDKYYNVIPDKKREGEYKFIKRRVPLDLPPQNNQHIERLPETKPPEQEKSITTSELLKEDKPKFPNEFFQFQTNINNSLQKTLEDLQEKYNSLSNKFDESRKAKPKRTVKKSKPKPKPKKEEKKQEKVDKASEEEYEIEYEYVEEPPKTEPVQTEQIPQQQFEQSYVPFIRRRQINIKDF